MNIIHLSRDKEFSNLLAANLQGHFEINFIYASSFEEAESFYQLFSDIDYFMVDFHQFNSEEFKNFQTSLDHGQTPVIFHGAHEKKVESNCVFLPYKQMNEFIESCISIFNGTHSGTEGNVTYRPIAIDFFYYFSSSPVDLFVRMNKDQEQHYVKIFNAGDEYEDVVLRNYEQKGLGHLWTRKHELPTLQKVLNERFAAVIEKTTSSEDPLGKIQQTVFRQLTELGISRATIQVAGKSIDKMKDNLVKEKTFSEMFDQLENAKAPLPYQHSYMTAIIAYAMLNEFTWSSKINKDLVIYCAYLAHISLPSKELLFLSQEMDVAEIKARTDDKKKILEHAKNSAKMISKSKSVPMGLDKIILEHHGSFNGIGFPTSISSKISPLSVAYMMADQFVCEFLSRPETQANPEIILAELAERFGGPKVDETLAALRAVVMKKIEKAA